MADYYPLISRALDGLSDKSPDMRRAVFDRARSALVAQLQSLDPPLPTAEITRERLALDEAIDRVEAEFTLGEASLAAPPVPPAPETPPPEPEAAGSTDFHPEPGPPPGRIRTEPLRQPIPEREFEGMGEDEPPPQRERPRVDTVSRVRADPERGRAVVLAGVLVLVVALIGVAAWLLRVQPSELQEQTAAAETSKSAQGDSKTPERVTDRLPGAGPAPGPSQPGASPPRADVPVAQRAILYEENQAEPQNPKASPGRALWRVDAINPGQGQPLEMVVRSNVEIPGAGLSLALALRRNADPALPASHIIELTFTTPDDPNRVVRDVGLLQFKGDEAVRGTPLAGLPVPVKDNVFLIGLSNLPGDMERNQDLMLRRNWIDLPIRFASGQRAILSFEKGISGDQVLNDAFRHWQSNK